MMICVDGCIWVYVQVFCGLPCVGFVCFISLSPFFCLETKETKVQDESICNAIAGPCSAIRQAARLRNEDYCFGVWMLMFSVFFFFLFMSFYSSLFLFFSRNLSHILAQTATGCLPCLETKETKVQDESISPAREGAAP